MNAIRTVFPSSQARSAQRHSSDDLSLPILDESPTTLEQACESLENESTKHQQDGKQYRQGDGDSQLGRHWKHRKIVRTEEQHPLGVEVTRKRRKHKTDKHAKASLRNENLSPLVTLHTEMDYNVPSRSAVESDTSSSPHTRQQDNQVRSNEINDDHGLNSQIRITPTVDAEADPPLSQDHSVRVVKGEAQCERGEQQAAGNKRKRRRRNRDIRDQDDEDNRPHGRPTESPTNAQPQVQGLKPKKIRESGAQKKRKKRERRDAYRNLERICARCQKNLESEFNSCLDCSDYDLCRVCVESGIYCVDRTHSWIKRALRGDARLVDIGRPFLPDGHEVKVETGICPTQSNSDQVERSRSLIRDIWDYGRDLSLNGSALYPYPQRIKVRVESPGGRLAALNQKYYPVQVHHDTPSSQDTQDLLQPELTNDEEAESKEDRLAAINQEFYPVQFRQDSDTPSSQRTRRSNTQDLLQPGLVNNEGAPADEDNMNSTSLQHPLPQTLQDDSVDQDQTAITTRCSTHERLHNSLFVLEDALERNPDLMLSRRYPPLGRYIEQDQHSVKEESATPDLSRTRDAIHLDDVEYAVPYHLWQSPCSKRLCLPHKDRIRTHVHATSGTWTQNRVLEGLWTCFREHLRHKPESFLASTACKDFNLPESTIIKDEHGQNFIRFGIGRENQKLAIHDGFLNLHHPSSHLFHKIFESEALRRMSNDEYCVYLPDEDMDTFKLFCEWTVKEYLGNGPDMPKSPKIWQLDTAKAVKMLRFADRWGIHSMRKEILSYIG